MHYSDMEVCGEAANMLWAAAGVGGTDIQDRTMAAGAMDFNALVELHAENEGAGFAELQAKLVKNYAVELKIGVRVWMRSGTNPGESSSSSSRNAEKVSDWH